MITIASLIRYRMQHERLVKAVTWKVLKISTMVVVLWMQMRSTEYLVKKDTLFVVILFALTY